MKDIGYDQDGFSFHGADIEVLLHGQSPDIAMGVDAKKKKGGDEEGAGDQGMMFGYACTDRKSTRRARSCPPRFSSRTRSSKVLSDKRRSEVARRPAARREEPGDGSVRQRQGCRLRPRSSSRPSTTPKVATARSTRRAMIKDLIVVGR